MEQEIGLVSLFPSLVFVSNPLCAQDTHRHILMHTHPQPRQRVEGPGTFSMCVSVFVLGPV